MASQSRQPADLGRSVADRATTNGIVFQKLTALIRQTLGWPQTESAGQSDIGTAHLQYDSVEDWMTGETVPMGFIKEPDPILRDKYIRQYGELRRHLYAKHVATLSPDVQQAINDGCHPSQSHRFADEAQPYCELLQHHLESVGLDVSDVHLGWYHMDRVVLSVETTEQLDASRFRKLPWLFQGFEIKYMSSDRKDATEQSGERAYWKWSDDKRVRLPPG